MLSSIDIDKLAEKAWEAYKSEHKDEFPEPPVELYRILEYLPEEFSDDSEEKYIRALVLAAETSYENALYQFAYVQYHMLFMTAVYYAILKVSILHEEELKKALYYLLKDRYPDFWKETNTKNGKLYFGSFAVINESDVFMLLRVVGLNNDLLGELQNLVKERNKYAHANGQLLLTSDELFMDSLNNYNAKIQMVIDLLKDNIVSYYKTTISDPDFYDPDIRAYSDPDEQIVQEFIKKLALSRIEINWLRKIKLSEFDSYDGKEDIKTLHCSLIHYYRKITQDDYHPFDDSYIVDKYRDKADDFVESELGISAYECGKEGGEFPVYECPECGAEQLVYDAEAGRFHCFSCDKNFTTEELSFCPNCGRLMHNKGESVCDDCFEYALNKD